LSCTRADVDHPGLLPFGRLRPSWRVFPRDPALCPAAPLHPNATGMRGMAAVVGAAFAA